MMEEEVVDDNNDNEKNKEGKKYSRQTGGYYNVKESGIDFFHMPPPPTPRNGQEFLNRFSAGFELNILEHSNPNELVFELIGIDISFANALRRILIAELPTMAIEHVYIWNNTSIVHDEVLAHRLGLVPINVDPRLFFDRIGTIGAIGPSSNNHNNNIGSGDGGEEEEEEEDDPTEYNTIVFSLKVSCARNATEEKRLEQIRRARDEHRNTTTNTNTTTTDNNDSILSQPILDRIASEAAESHQTTSTSMSDPISNEITEAMENPNGRPYTKNVYSGDLQWVPQSTQGTRFNNNGIRPVHEDILLAKLRPGQCIELECHARRGVGKDHAKFSPVATASYRLMTNVELIKPVYDEYADLLVNLYEPGVFRIVPCDDTDNNDHDEQEEEQEDGTTTTTTTTKGRRTRTCHQRKAVVDNPYACTMSRNFMRHPILKDCIKMTRIPDHVIFSVESVGMMSPAVLVAESLRVLKAKCERLVALVMELDDDLDHHDRHDNDVAMDQ